MPVFSFTGITNYISIRHSGGRVQRGNPESRSKNCVREPLIKSLHRHAGENDPQDVGNVARGHGVRSDQHPVTYCFDWILACARMTTQRILRLNQRFLS